MGKNIKCQLCNSSAELKHDRFQGYQKDTFFEIYFCNDCYTSFSMPRANANNIYQAIYKNGNKVPGYDRYWNYYKEIKNEDNPLNYLANSEEAYWGIKEALNQNIKDKKSTKILELGSGLGYLTYALREENFDVKGLDISQEAVDKANDVFGQNYICKGLFDYAKIHPSTYDIVILTEVIEHIEVPIEFLTAITEILKPRGKIILTTPNRTLMTPDIIWDSDLPPVHHWWFSEGSMKHIAQKINLDISFINFSKFYKKYHRVYNLQKKRKNELPEAILGKNLELIREGSPLKKKKKKLIYSIPLIEAAYLKYKTLINPNNIIFSEKGVCLCAVFSKKE